jgi:ribosomal protein S6--L-glutamate ligase
MKIGIISNSASIYSTSRLRDAARKRNHTVRILNTAKFAIHVKSGTPNLLYSGKPLPIQDAIIPRIAASQNFFGTAVIRQFEQMGIFSLNASHAVSVARDKLRTLQIFSRHRISIPESVFVFGKGDIDAAIETLGGTPLIIKLIEGSQGAGVMLAESISVARAIIEAAQVVGQKVLIQKFVSESKGRDIRAFVVGDRVVAAMRRTAKEGEFRANVHQGGSTEPAFLDAEYEKVAIKAAQIIGLRVAGVDLLESDDGPKVLEVNSSPGLEGIEAATQLDIANEIINYLEEQVQFPDLDLRERLSLSKGYSIAEFPIHKNSSLVNKELNKLDLAEQEIQILSINRNGIIIPTPRPNELLHAGDILLCYGKQLMLKGLLPPVKSRKNNKKNDKLQNQI